MSGPISVSELKNIAPLPQSVIRLAKIVADPNSTIDEFSRVIEYDAPLTANVLRWANSAWSQTQTSIANVHKAVIRLGSENVLKLSIGYHLMAPMSRSFPGYNMTENDLWRHSVSSALAAEKITRLCLKKIPPAAFTAALMHDIGKIVLGRRLGHESLGEMIETLMEEQQLSYLEAEREVMGTDHAEVGAAIAKEWKLPDLLVNAIARHHDIKDNTDLLLDTIHVADVIAKCIDEEKCVEEIDSGLHLASLQRMGISGFQLAELCESVRHDLLETEGKWAEH